MADRKQVSIHFASPEAYVKHNEEVIKIIKDDTGKDDFISNPSYPPIYHPSPLTDDAISKLKALDGVDVK